MKGLTSWKSCSLEVNVGLDKWCCSSSLNNKATRSHLSPLQTNKDRKGARRRNTLPLNDFLLQIDKQATEGGEWMHESPKTQALKIPYIQARLKGRQLPHLKLLLKPWWHLYSRLNMFGPLTHHKQKASTFQP
jgi:hypothetical protein